LENVGGFNPPGSSNTDADNQASDLEYSGAGAGSSLINDQIGI